MQEAGVDLRFWFALFGPKGLPDAVKRSSKVRPRR
jgi:hypothetical protein